MDLAVTIAELKRTIKALSQRAKTQAENIAALAISATNQATQIAAINNKTQAVNQAITLTAGIALDVTITWPDEWPDTAYNIIPIITSGTAVLGQIHATPKAASKTTTDCTVTVLSPVAVASAGLYVLGIRT